MKITESVIITGVPGVESITVKPGELIEICYVGREYPQSYGTEELEQFRDALTVALDRAKSMQPTPDTVGSLKVGEKLTEGMAVLVGTVVRDVEGSPWTRVNDGWVLGSADLSDRPRRSTTYLVNSYGPIIIESVPTPDAS